MHVYTDGDRDIDEILKVFVEFSESKKCSKGLCLLTNKRLASTEFYTYWF